MNAAEYMRTMNDGFRMQNYELKEYGNVKLIAANKFDEGFYSGFVKEKTKTPHSFGIFINKQNGSIY